MFFTLEKVDVCNYADDTGLHVCDKDLPNLLYFLEHDTHIANEWFESNYMKSNKDNCHFLISGHKFEHLWINVGDAKIWESNSVTLLGVQIDSSLKFDKHVIELCKKAGRKLSALKRLAKILPFQKMRILMKSFFDSQFSCCPLTWMFINRGTNHKVNRLHERSLRILYKDYVCSYAELLQKDNSVTVHTRNIQLLAIEIYKVKQHISPNFISEIFPPTNIAYNLRNTGDFKRTKVNTVLWGSETIRYIGPIIWDLLPLNIQTTPTQKSFISKVKNGNQKIVPVDYAKIISHILVSCESYSICILSPFLFCTLIVSLLLFILHILFYFCFLIINYKYIMVLNLFINKDFYFYVFFGLNSRSRSLTLYNLPK